MSCGGARAPRARYERLLVFMREKDPGQPPNHCNATVVLSSVTVGAELGWQGRVSTTFTPPSTHCGIWCTWASRRVRLLGLTLRPFHPRSPVRIWCSSNTVGPQSERCVVSFDMMRWIHIPSLSSRTLTTACCRPVPTTRNSWRG